MSSQRNTRSSAATLASKVRATLPELNTPFRQRNRVEKLSEEQSQFNNQRNDINQRLQVVQRHADAARRQLENLERERQSLQDEFRAVNDQLRIRQDSINQMVEQEGGLTSQTEIENLEEEILDGMQAHPELYEDDTSFEHEDIGGAVAYGRRNAVYGSAESESDSGSEKEDEDPVARTSAGKTRPAVVRSTPAVEDESEPSDSDSDVPSDSSSDESEDGSDDEVVRPGSEQARPASACEPVSSSDSEEDEALDDLSDESADSD